MEQDIIGQQKIALAEALGVTDIKPYLNTFISAAAQLAIGEEYDSDLAIRADEQTEVALEKIGLVYGGTMARSPYSFKEKQIQALYTELGFEVGKLLRRDQLTGRPVSGQLLPVFTDFSLKHLLSVGVPGIPTTYEGRLNPGIKIAVVPYPDPNNAGAPDWHVVLVGYKQTPFSQN